MNLPVDPALFTPPGDYLIRAKDDMEDIRAGDYLVIHRTQEARKGQMVLAGGVVRRFGKKDPLGVDGIVVGMIRNLMPTK